MSTPFSNPVAAGSGVLVLPSIHSPNFVHNVSGWTINADGSVEFNNGTFRGTVTAATIVGSTIENSATNPKTSINPDGTVKITDASGNVIFQISADGTLTWFSAAGAQLMQISPTGFISVTDPAFLEFPSGASFENTIAQIASRVGGISPAQFIQLALVGASDTLSGARDKVEITLNSANADNSSNANMEFIYVGSNGTAHEYAFCDSTGFNIVAGSILGVDPGSSPAVAASWHTIALQNAYTAGTNNGFLDVPQVRMMAENNNLQFKGSLTCPAAPASNNWGTLPAGFPNANLGGPFGYGAVANYSGGTSDHVVVQNSSNIALNNGTAHGGITFNISCIVPTQ